MALLRRPLGDVLRRHRLSQDRTLREVAATARVSLGYLSEVERGQKEASSELLAAICAALGVRLADVLREVSDCLAVLEPVAASAIGVVVPAPRPDLVPAFGSLDAVVRPVGVGRHVGEVVAAA